MTTESALLTHVLPQDARSAREWVQHGIDHRNKDTWKGLYVYSCDMVVASVISALDTVGYLYLAAKEPTCLLLRLHPRSALSKLGENLCKTVASVAGVFFCVGLAIATVIPNA